MIFCSIRPTNHWYCRVFVSCGICWSSVYDNICIWSPDSHVLWYCWHKWHRHQWSCDNGNVHMSLNCYLVLP